MICRTYKGKFDFSTWHFSEDEEFNWMFRNRVEEAFNNTCFMDGKDGHKVALAYAHAEFLYDKTGRIPATKISFNIEINENEENIEFNFDLMDLVDDVGEYMEEGKLIYFISGLRSLINRAEKYLEEIKEEKQA